MRKIVYAMNISIDGCYDHTMIDGDAELHEHFANLGQDVDLTIYGRKMYELMVPYWTEVAKKKTAVKGTDDFAKTIIELPKIVFSTTLQQADVDGNTTILRGDLEDEVRKLKALPGKNISIAGMTLRSQLTAAGLVDEYHFVIHPLLIGGDGPRLMAGIGFPEKLKLKLLSSTILRSGAVGLHYIKA
ncbi:dihydrofolate reductase family protein [Mucilaginibacter myungsuensis]|uniref:Dihydrofolate reductase family protein n=1 Tax=Mucilaginibacter myungsuensis TaxID=649104 RepID=A0A929L0X9_9SPHI|nr:dihydrofolate reductase family protein [Mucilaginibacter myungsuensis]MBE9664108.1 dihydrofolate reductase family protein [Mucilaginibacter myungsuensis]MDN3601287.1 dihydrofolate reductase family protein [Mucilaginibacter myungsuensis]